MRVLIERAAWLGFIFSLLGVLLGGWGLGLSILLGASAAWVNFHWMQKGIDRVLAGGVREKSDLKIGAEYVLRLLLILATLFAIIHFSFLNLLGGILGLSIFVLAGMLEAVILLYRQIRRGR